MGLVSENLKGTRVQTTSPSVSPYVLYKVVEKGVDLTTVSKLAGHSTVNMTAKFYIQTTKQEKMDAVNLL